MTEYTNINCPVCGTELEVSMKEATVTPMTRIEQFSAEKENNSMDGFNNEMNMKKLADMVFERVMQAQATATQPTQIPASVSREPKAAIQEVHLEIINNGWASHSKFYGKEICGFMYDPFMIRRWIQGQFERLMRRDLNVHRQIVRMLTYQASIKYTKEEIRKLAMLEKRDITAFAERRHMFSLELCKLIFMEMLKEYKAMINRFGYTYNKKPKEDPKVKEVHVYSIALKNSCLIGTVVPTVVKKHIEYRFQYNSDNYDQIMNTVANLHKQLAAVKSYAELYKLVSESFNFEKVLSKQTDKSKAFMDAYIKSGAYYTLKQNYMFDAHWALSDRRRLVNALRAKLGTLKGYQMYGFLKEEFAKVGLIENGHLFK